MKIGQLDPKEIPLKQSLNKAYRLVKPKRQDIELFKTNLITLLGQIDTKESEENVKIHLMNFMRDTFYHPAHLIATKGRTDFVIHTGKDAATPAGVLFEVKRPTNTGDMVTKANFNTKAMHELMLYYLRERVEHKNTDIRHLVITNIHEWVIFDAQVFEKLFYNNKSLINDYTLWAAKQKVSIATDLFYNEVAKPFLASLQEELSFTWFDIRLYERALKNTDKCDDNKLVPLFKVFSPTHLLKMPFANDSNSLDRGFYTELLHIIGLEEVKEGSKKIIRRKKEGNRNDGSLLENAIAILDTDDSLRKVPALSTYGDTKEEQLFSVGLELCITWINRILFLKLLEAQLLRYHKGDNNYRFLFYGNLPQYDELYKLFFQVLARKPEERLAKVKDKFQHVPYLNSSLFELSDLEDATIKINMLDNSAELPLISSTVLRNERNKPRAEKLNTLQYLFEFLDAYDFTSEGGEEIQEQGKTLINASVLGLIFEKINGYKDGSFFTPGFITMYMCREAIRRAVVQKFNDAKGWDCKSITDVYNRITDRTEANQIINSLTICDPAVGSGHFLVSALNEIIAIKSEMELLQDSSGKRLKNYDVEVVNDELIISDDNNELFEYNPKSAESRRVQETLFHEKQTIIENCLFGVDINPKSVQICRLRLWIELLKNAYYKSTPNGDALETLPNIDINIKTGNSLVSRFAIDADLKQALKGETDWGKAVTVESYRSAVAGYRNAQSKEEKQSLLNLINKIKSQFRTEIETPFKKKISEARGKVDALTGKITNLKAFGQEIDKKLFTEFEKSVQLLEKLEKEKEEIQSNKIYENAFEWRFEFPEVLNDKGDFVGFDVVIGNPPYSSSKDFDKSLMPFLKSNYVTSQYQLDLYVSFIELSIKVIRPFGIVSLITPNSWLKNMRFTEVRSFLLSNISFAEIFPNLENIFTEASVDTLIFIGEKRKDDAEISIKEFVDQIAINKHLITQSNFSLNERYTFNVEVSTATNSIFEKIKSQSICLQDIADITRGVNPYDKYAGHTQEQIKNKVFHASFKKDETFVPEIRGKHVSSYAYSWDGKHFISYGNWLAAPRDKKYFIGERLIMRQVLGKTLFCTIISEPMIIDQSIFIAKLKTEEEKNYSLNFVQGILASKLLSYFFRHSNNEFDALFPKIKIGEFRELPVPKISFKNQEEISNRVVSLLQMDNSKSEVIKEIISEIDQLVYQLYGLTEEEIKIVEGAT